jgi:CRP-like cAMP-binding protein
MPHEERRRVAFMRGCSARAASPTTSFDRIRAVAEFLGLLSDADRAELERIGHRKTADRPELLLAIGEAADRVLVLESGRVKVTVPTSAGTDAVLTFRGPGALLGEQALVDQRPRSANVAAIEPVEMLVIAASTFRTFLAAHPDVALAMLAMLSARLRDSDRRLAEFAAADTLGRVSARLVELCDAHGDPGTDGTVRITLPITQEDLAGWTGSSIESTAKALRQLRSLGWITTGRRALEVHDLPALRRRAP